MKLKSGIIRKLCYLKRKIDKEFERQFMESIGCYNGKITKEDAEKLMKKIEEFGKNNKN